MRIPSLNFSPISKAPSYTMEITVLLAAGLRDWVDFDIIIGILVLNTFVRWYQEKQAGDIVAQLKVSITFKATVIRDGQEQDIVARDIVPGDIIKTNTILADGKILASYDDKNRSKAKAIEQKIEVTRRHKEIMESQPKQTK
ncbi:hypothetical protein M422DRAFT_262409 [Sphaerobolus stellatus SS14]|uniref:P-type ATPase A domain-containing protein n=1 Tax=Sphaerobolus stellatus (strain SS14) TaxID=990650 RepID=A0A0C9V1D9_SPHS4|nr:hypothetical protein M422DRAFT_262409 [Sphaerobolus stellatus SS14]